MAAAFWELRQFSLAHRAGGERLLSATDLKVPAGGFYLLVGESGGGKSTLLRLSCGLWSPRAPGPEVGGELLCLGAPVHRGMPPELRARIGAVLQEEGLLDELSPRANVELALRAAGRSRRLAPALLAQVGLDPAPEHAAQLSGGQRKRLAVARALATEPEVLFCDEPTAGLDPDSARTIARLLRDSHERRPGRTTVVITHDVAAFAGLCDGILVLDRGRRSLRLESPEWCWHGAAEPRREAVGCVGDELLHGARAALLRLASIGESLGESILRLPPVEAGQTLRMLAHCATAPLGFVAAGSAVIGGLATFFALRNNPVPGAMESALVAGTGKVLCAVLIPLLVGFFFTARIAAGAAARIASMQRTRQIQALSLMGIRPADYLLTPLVWGMVLCLPLVTAASVVAAAFAAMFAAGAASGIPAASFAAAFFRNVDATDAIAVVGKAMASGYLVAVTCYHLGTAEQRSGADIGATVNRAVVLGMTLVLVVHAAATLLTYA